MALIVPKTAKTEALLKHNAENSPLLKIPRELRDRIYIEIFRGRTIHITRPKPKKRPVYAPHGFATLLSTSQQIYEEANHIFWSTNKFTFDHPLAFAAWFEKLKENDKESLRSLGFVMDLSNDSRRWTDSLYEYGIKQMSGVFTLDLDIHLYQNRSNPDVDAMTQDDMYLGGGWLDVVGSLARLPLTRVEVRITPNEDEYRWCTKDNTWTESQRQRCAELVKTMLLDPDPVGTEAKILQARWDAQDEANESWFRSPRPLQGEIGPCPSMEGF